VPKRVSRTMKVARKASAPATRAKAGGKTALPDRKGLPMAPPTSGVAVRMYRQGLGDCFLLAFPRSGRPPFYMLIDCGVLVGQGPNRPDIRKVARHIAESTGRHLDVVVATHQHWDHLSGFVDALEEFSKIKVDRLLLAWTEDPKDEIAARLRGQRMRLALSLKAAATRVAAAADPDLSPASKAWAESLNGVLGFLGADGGRTTEQALKNVSGLCTPTYCKPGDSLKLDVDEADVRVHVLGPPHDEKQIKQYNDKASDPQTYKVADAALDAQAAFLAAALGEGDGDGAFAIYPFESSEQIGKARARARYSTLWKDAFESKKAWRRIGLDWIQSASNLALQLDNATNNTSLALAIELGQGGKVLLFPADAQVGNWLSWHDHTWKDAGGKTINAADLLARTVLYKVGHHSSHNATLRQRGLELMVSDDLIAMVPLDRETAKKKHWVMPWPKLRTGLVKATKGRILQVDDEKPASQLPAWKNHKKMITGENELYYEVSIAG
jgi:ribonuclease BN (tRNA processing enzyme)